MTTTFELFTSHFFCLIYSSSSIAVKDRFFTTSKTLVYWGYWGSWGSWQYCRNGGYAVSFDQKVESPLGDGDDTALNGICLQCSTGGEVCSSYGDWGSWVISSKCYAGFRGADFKVEGKQGDSDDTAANGLELVCSSGGGYTTSNMGGWGSWWGYKYCISGQRICGIQTRVEGRQGNGDDTALNGVDLMCCGKISSVKVGLVQIFSRAGDGNPDPDGAKYTKQVKSTAGLITNAGYYNTATVYDIASRVQGEVDYSTAAGRITSDQHLQEVVKGIFLSALNNRHGSSSVTLPVPVNVYQDVHAYVGEATIAMSDGSVLKFRGSEMVKSIEQLDTSSSCIL